MYLLLMYASIIISASNIIYKYSKIYKYYVMNYSINSFTGASEASAYGGYVKKLIY